MTEIRKDIGGNDYDGLIEPQLIEERKRVLGYLSEAGIQHEGLTLANLYMTLNGISVTYQEGAVDKMGSFVPQISESMANVVKGLKASGRLEVTRITMMNTASILEDVITSKELDIEEIDGLYNPAVNALRGSIELLS